MQGVMNVGEEDNEEGTEVTRKKKGATKENLTAKKLALLKAKDDKEV
jgi:hypothetical protein